MGIKALRQSRPAPESLAPMAARKSIPKSNIYGILQFGVRGHGSYAPGTDIMEWRCIWERNGRERWT